MREIKYRVWNKVWKCMYYLTGFRYVGKNRIQLYYIDSDGDNTTCTILLENIILMQCTGLKDKNEVEIYEGDIIKLDNEISVIRFDEKTARFVIDDYGIQGCMMEYGWDESVGGFEVVDTNGFDDFNDLSDIDVIGNIHENPELLQGV